MGLRERKRAETHRALALAALRLAAERGFDGVTVEDICAAVNVSARTFFNYFASKEDAIVQPYPDDAAHLARSADAIVDAPAELSPLWAAAAGMRREFARVEADRDEWLTRMSVVLAHPALLARIARLGGDQRELLTAAVARRTGHDPRDWYPRLVYSVVDGAGYAAMEQWYQQGGQPGLIELLDQAVAAVAEGLPNPG